MIKKTPKYYLNRLKKYLTHPIKTLKVRKLVDVKLLPNPDAKFVDASSIRHIYDYFLEPEFVKVDQFLEEAGLLEDSSYELAESLRLLFDTNGSDKGTFHGYYKFYQPIISQQIRTKKNCVIFEVGIGSNNIDVQSNMGLEGTPGASARAFRNFSPNCRLIIGDIDKRILFEEERISSYYVDQLNIQTLNSFFNISKYDIAIDDGLHILRSNINFFISAFEKKSSNSWIIIEDINLKDIKFWKNISNISKKTSSSWVIKANHSFMFIMYLN